MRTLGQTFRQHATEVADRALSLHDLPEHRAPACGPRRTTLTVSALKIDGKYSFAECRTRRV